MEGYINMDYIVFKSVMEHIEVFINNVFAFSADTKAEAVKELKAQLSI
jgi:hypothetical protein